MINKRHQTEKMSYGMVPFIGNPRTSKLWGQKADQLVPGSGGERKALIRKGHKGILGGILEMFYIIISLVLM